ncbi:unnamed protein product [Heterobilharzia americana]|nr:unnamed protein product [Heterobilharzia americana]
MRINITLITLLKTTAIIMIINSFVFINAESWHNILRLVKRNTHRHEKSSSKDLYKLKNALENYALQMNSHKSIGLLGDPINLTQSNIDNFTEFNTDSDLALTLSNYSSDANSIADYIQDSNFKDYISEQTIKHSKYSSKSSTLTTVQVVSNKSHLHWSILQFSLGLLCLMIHMIWFLWLLYHNVLIKFRHQSAFHKSKTNSYSKPLHDVASDFSTKRYQLILRTELHLSFVGTIYGFVISIRRISSLVLGPEWTSSVKQPNLISRNYLMCYLTRHISLSLLTVYWISILLMILINIHYIKSIYLVNSAKIPLIIGTFTPLYIAFIISWIFSIVIRIGSLLINYNLQKYALRHLTESKRLTTKQVLNFECMNTKDLEHQKMYFILCVIKPHLNNGLKYSQMYCVISYQIF